jgi:hypothetical protein
MVQPFGILLARTAVAMPSAAALSKHLEPGTKFTFAYCISSFYMIDSAYSFHSRGRSDRFTFVF